MVSRSADNEGQVVRREWGEMMPEFEYETFVRVLANDRNHGKLGIVVKPRLDDEPPSRSQVWVEMASDDPFGGVYRALYHVSQLRVADALKRHSF